MKDWLRKYELKSESLYTTNHGIFMRDILVATSNLVGVKFEMGTLDDMNGLENKHICYVANLLQDQFTFGYGSFRKYD